MWLRASLRSAGKGSAAVTVWPVLDPAADRQGGEDDGQVGLDRVARAVVDGAGLQVGRYPGRDPFRCGQIVVEAGPGIVAADGRVV